MSTPATRALRVALRGDSILTHPRFNKGTAFPAHERKAFGLTGRLPYRANTLEEQCRRAYDQLITRETPIRKNTFLQSLKDQNLTLYYGLLSRHLKELIPIIYTPTQVSFRPSIECRAGSGNTRDREGGSLTWSSCRCFQTRRA